MKIFITDGLPDTFFSAVFAAYGEKDCTVSSDTQLQLPLDGEIINVVYDKEKSRRVLQTINKYDGEAESDITLVLHSGDSRKEQICLEYIRILVNNKAPVKNMLNNAVILSFNDLIYKMTGEIHRLKGLLRFTESAEKILYAPYSPDNDITEYLMRHFAARLKSEKFVIHDIKRGTAGVYDGEHWILGKANAAQISISESQGFYEKLWKTYYESTNVKERPHDKQMKRSMPVRYWKFLPEKK